MTRPTETKRRRSFGLWGRTAGGAARRVVGLPFRGLGLAARTLWTQTTQGRPWLKLALLGIPLLVILAILSPVAGILGRILDAIGALLRPLLESPAGRFVLANAALILLAWVFWRLLRGRLRRLLGAYVLSKYLEGLSSLLKGEDVLATRRFRSALWWASWIDLSLAVPELPGLKGDASIRLAMVVLRKGRVNEALRHLLRIRHQDLAPETRSSYHELLARAYCLHPSLGREAVDAKLDELLAEEPRNPRLLDLIRARRQEANDWASAAKAQERILGQLTGAALEEGKKRLALLYLEHARQTRTLGEPDKAMRIVRQALKEWPNMQEALILLGDLVLELGQTDKAIRTWAQAPGLLALERLEGIAQSEPESVLANRCLAKAFPHVGILIILARRWLDQGELRLARNAVRKLLELGERSPRVLTLYASILERMGEHDQAAQACREALGVTLQLPVSGAGERPFPEKGGKIG